MAEKPSGSYRLRVTVGYYDALRIARSDKREATFEADDLDSAIAEADEWLQTYREFYEGNWYAMDDVGLYDQASDGLLATLGGPDGDDWEIVGREADLPEIERAQIGESLIATAGRFRETAARIAVMIALGQYAEALTAMQWLPLDSETMQRNLRKLIEG